MPKHAQMEPSAHTRAVWQQLAAHQGETFFTAKGLPFTYAVRGGELFVDRRQKSITIATVDAALRNIEARLESGEEVTGPKKIGCYGASYLYPVFLQLGVLPAPDTQLELKDFIPTQDRPHA